MHDLDWDVTVQLDVDELLQTIEERYEMKDIFDALCVTTDAVIDIFGASSLLADMDKDQLVIYFSNAQNTLEHVVRLVTGDDDFNIKEKKLPEPLPSIVDDEQHVIDYVNRNYGVKGKEVFSLAVLKLVVANLMKSQE